MLTAYVPFNVVLTDNTILPVKDIFLFRNIMMNFFTDSNSFMRYTIQSGDTPRSLAYYLYGGEKFEWILYCLNTMVNPYFEWPLSENDFYDMIEDKYLGKQCFFLKMDSFTNNFVKGQVITSGSKTAVIDSWDRTLCKLTVKNVVGAFQVNDVITSSSSTGTIGRVVELAEEALHHFETESGVVLDPYVGYLQLYINGGDETYVVTNKMNEEKINNKKRQIFVLRPEYATAAENLLIRNFKKLSEFENESSTS